jgi:hypothetical protein
MRSATLYNHSDDFFVMTIAPTEPSPSECDISQLPSDILYIIAKQLTPYDLMRLAQANRRFRVLLPSLQRSAPVSIRCELSVFIRLCHIWPCFRITASMYGQHRTPRWYEPLERHGDTNANTDTDDTLDNSADINDSDGHPAYTPPWYHQRQGFVSSLTKTSR